MFFLDLVLAMFSLIWYWPRTILSPPLLLVQSSLKMALIQRKKSEKSSRL